MGWDPEARRRNLPLVVNNARALPWVRIKNLASHVLTLVERRLPDDWESRYAPVLLETFCETPRFAGTCYRAASKVGATQGRGSTRRECALPVKDAEAPAAGLEADPQKIDRHLTSERLLKPWYVGKAEKTRFSSEVFNKRNQKMCRDISEKPRKFHLFLLAKLTPKKRKFGKPQRSRHIQHLEVHLISWALKRNKDLFNVQYATIFKELEVPGLFNDGPGQPPSEVQDLKRTLGL